jgi:hypothetical protein
MPCSNPYAPSAPCCSSQQPPSCGCTAPAACCAPSSVCCAPTGPTGPANPLASGSFTVGYFSTAPATIPSSVGFFVPFNVFLASNSPSYLIGTGVYQAPASGLYLFNVTIGISAAAATSVITSILRNNVQQLSHGIQIAVAGLATQQLNTVLQLAGGDIVQIQSQKTGEGAATLAGSDVPGYLTSLSVTPLSAS